MKKNNISEPEVFKFKVYSMEDQEFSREFEILGNQTFFDLHSVIQKSTGYDKNQMASFYICDENWEKGNEITLFEMSDDESDALVMDMTQICEQVNEKFKRLVYVYDFFSERAFFIEFLGTFSKKENTDYPILSYSSGEAPQQIVFNDKEDNDFDDIFDEESEPDEFHLEKPSLESLDEY